MKIISFNLVTMCIGFTNFRRPSPDSWIFKHVVSLAPSTYPAFSAAFIPCTSSAYPAFSVPTGHYTSSVPSAHPNPLHCLYPLYTLHHLYTLHILHISAPSAFSAASAHPAPYAPHTLLYDLDLNLIWYFLLYSGIIITGKYYFWLLSFATLVPIKF